MPARSVHAPCLLSIAIGFASIRRRSALEIEVEIIWKRSWWLRVTGGAVTLVPARSTRDSTRESNHRRAERVGLKNY